VNSSTEDVVVTFYPPGKPSVVLSCEVAKTGPEKTTGLMYRSSLPREKGMLFVFWCSWPRTFWMKHVSIPLDIIFINSKCTVISIHETSVGMGFFNKEFWACGFGKYVIECNKGFCATHHISRGTKILIQDKKGIQKNTKNDNSIK